MRSAKDKCHDRLFIMTDVICHTFIYCSKWWTNAQSVPWDCIIKMPFWTSVTSQQSFSFLLTVSQRDQLWLVSQQVVKLFDWLHNVCWHGDQLSLLRQLVLMKHKLTTVCSLVAVQILIPFPWAQHPLTDSLVWQQTNLFHQASLDSCVVMAIRWSTVVLSQARTLIIMLSSTFD